MKMLNIFALIVLLFAGCDKEPIVVTNHPPIPCPFLCDTSKLEMVWQQPLSFDTSELFSISPVIFNNRVLFSRSFSIVDTLKCFDSKTGRLVWQWADYFLGRKSAITLSHKEFLQNGKFLFTTWNDVYCVDVGSGRTHWRSQLQSGSGNPRINETPNYVYHVNLQRANAVTINSYLVRADINEGKWDTIYTQSKIEGFEPNIEPASVSWTNTKGEEIVFFQIRYWDFPGSKGRIDWLALNLTTKKEEFRFNNIDRGQIGTVANAFLSGDKVYFLCVNSLFCINKNDGKIIWRKNFDKEGETFTSASPLIAEGKLFIKPDNSTLYALDPDTGNQIWVDTDNGTESKGIIYYDGLLYYTSGGDAKIYAVEAATGKKIWAEPSPNKYKNALNGNRRFSNANIGFGGIAIDPEQGVLFTSDFYFAMCLKLPKK